MSRLYAVSAFAGGLCLVAITLVVLIQIVGRMFGILVPVASEFAGYLLAGTIFLTIPYAFREGAHVRITLLQARLAPAMARRLEVLCLAVCLAVTVYVAWYATLGVWDSYRFNDRAMGLFATPVYIPKTVMALGFWLTGVALVHRLVELIAGGEGARS